MDKYDKSAELFEELSELAKKYNVSFITTQQPIRRSILPDSGKIHITKNRFNPIIVDHYNLL